MATFDFEKHFSSKISLILAKYGSTEQARLLIGTFTLIVVKPPNEVPTLLSKRTFYRHLEMLKMAGIVFKDTYHKDILKAYKKHQ